MARERRNISISKEANKILNQDHINASGLIDELVRAYAADDDIDDLPYFDHYEGGDE